MLHNPKSDRRTTAGVFHVAEGGYSGSLGQEICSQTRFSRNFVGRRV
jgi:hypothetical protein